MKLSDYMPKLYKNNVEMNNIINSEEYEFENLLKPDIDTSFYNTFVKTANEDGIRLFEELLQIPLDENKDNLEYRRARVLSKFATTGALTYRWLENNLINLVGKNNYQILLNSANYELTINISDVYLDTAEKIFDVYRPLIPANMKLFVNLFDNIECKLYTSNIIHEGDILYIKGEE